jgi:hypothetical protein
MSSQRNRDELRTIWLNLSSAVDSNSIKRCEKALDRLGRYIMEEEDHDD